MMMPPDIASIDSDISKREPLLISLTCFIIDKLSAMTPVPIPGNNLGWGNIFDSSSGYGGANDPFSGTKGHLSNQGYNAGNYFDGDA